MATTIRSVAARMRREARRTGGWGGIIYLLPALIILILFELWPIAFNLWISLWRWDVGPIAFVGLENYQRLFGEGFITRDYADQIVVGEAFESLIVTVYYVLGRVPLTIALSFGLAYLLFQGVRRGRAAFRVAYFLPYITSSIAVALVFTWIFNPRIGVVNALLEAWNLPTQKWLQDPLPAAKRILEWWQVGGLELWPNIIAGPSMALVVVILYSIWSSIGYSIVIYLAGLTGISTELYEAARIDGADGWALLRLIVWPLLKPITLFLLIVNTIGAFQAFDPIFALTRNTGMGRGEAGGPLDTTLTLPVYIYRNFYERSNSVGYAAAVAFLLFFILLGLTIIQFRTFGRNTHYQSE